MLSDDLVNVLFGADNDGSIGHTTYSNYRKVKKEDGIRIRDTIKEAYRRGEPERSSSCQSLEDTLAE